MKASRHHLGTQLLGAPASSSTSESSLRGASSGTRRFLAQSFSAPLPPSGSYPVSRWLLPTPALTVIRIKSKLPGRGKRQTPTTLRNRSDHVPATACSALPVLPPALRVTSAASCLSSPPWRWAFPKPAPPTRMWKRTLPNTPSPRASASSPLSLPGTAGRQLRIPAGPPTRPLAEGGYAFAGDASGSWSAAAGYRYHFSPGLEGLFAGAFLRTGYIDSEVEVESGRRRRPVRGGRPPRRPRGQPRIPLAMGKRRGPDPAGRLRLSLPVRCGMDPATTARTKASKASSNVFFGLDLEFDHGVFLLTVPGPDL